ncbi:DNA repair protein RecO [Pararhodospirillum photometricum]|nr:DNA repair protein RecO [Pararhodospirillum photometricum]
MTAWDDEGLVLSTRPLGETDTMVVILTAEHGRHAGALPGGQGRVLRPQTQTGTVVQVTWQARLEEHLGTWRLEALESVAPRVLNDRDRLAALASVCALCEVFLPERDPFPEVFDGLRLVLGLLAEEEEFLVWAGALACFERDLLDALGFGLDLESCALTGALEDLAYVSPRTGRAVTRAAAGPWIERLLVLPAFLRDDSVPETPEAVGAALTLTGHFLGRVSEVPLPEARTRFVGRLVR